MKADDIFARILTGIFWVALGVCAYVVVSYLVLN